MRFTRIRNYHWAALTLFTALAVLAMPALAQEMTFADPTGDDFGPGEYVYPTDAVYTNGSFDLTALEVEVKGDNVEFEVSVNNRLEDPWRMGTGFSVQMFFIFIDTTPGAGHTETLPGLNVQFAEADAWDKVVILSPQGASRVNTEVQQKAASLQDDIVVPARLRGSGRSVSARVKLDELGGGDPSTWGYQVVVQSNEGFPADNDLLTRKVNEFEGQHRFGGGTDYDCDPHAIDILGDAEAQKAQLAYECNADGSASKMATLKMVRSAG